MLQSMCGSRNGYRTQIHLPKNTVSSTDSSLTSSWSEIKDTGQTDHCMAAGWLWEKSSKTAEEESSLLLLQQKLLLKLIIYRLIKLITELYNCCSHIFTGILLVRFLLQEWGGSISSSVFDSSSFRLLPLWNLSGFLRNVVSFGVNLLRL